MSRVTLKKKIVTVLFLTSLVLISTLGGLIFFYLNKQLTDQKIKEITELSLEQTHETAKIFEKNQEFVSLIASQPEPSAYLGEPSEEKAQELLRIFLDYTRANPKYLSVYLLDLEGVALVSTDKTFVGQNYSFRDYFKKGLLGHSAVDVAIGKTSNQFGYYFSSPIRSSNGKVIGVLAAKIDNKEIDKAILNSQVAIDNNIMFVDEYGLVLSSNKAERFLKSLGTISKANQEMIKSTKRLLDQKVETLQYDNIQKIIDNYQDPQVVNFYDDVDGEDERVLVSRVANLPFFLVSEIWLDNIASLALSILIIIILIIIIGLVLFSFFVTKMMLFLVSPLKKFESVSKAIGAGDFSNKIEIKTNNEFGDLAKVFNRMSDDLNGLYTNLDKKVKQRTREIEIKSKEVENQKSAILNILEDVEREKDGAELLAQDLEKFKLAVESASDQVVITDAEGLVVYGNKSLERITGYKPEEVIGKKAASAWRVPMPKEYYVNMWDLIKNKKQTFIGEIKNKRKNGELYDANISISPVLNTKNEIVYFVALEHDISKEKEIDRAKTEFVSLASHQLRTPLSSINWYTEMLLAGDAGKINDEQKKYLEEIAIGNQRMVDLVNSLLNVSRLDLGTFIVEPEVLNIKEMLQSVVTEMSPQVIAKNLKIKQDYDKGIKEFSADKKLLRIVFQNLLSNAVKYTPDKGTVSLKLSVALKGETFGDKIMISDSLCFMVSDSGIGIPENQKDKIFSKMFRADNARESETEGTGLGLYIVKSIIDHSSGSIWFNSKEGQGSTFYATFLLSGMKKKEGSRALD